MNQAEILRRDQARNRRDDLLREKMLSCPPAIKGGRLPEGGGECLVPEKARKLILGAMGTDWIASRDVVNAIGEADSRGVGAKLASLRTGGWVESETRGNRLEWKRTGKAI